MAHLSSSLLSWMTVSILFCALLIACIPARAQVNMATQHVTSSNDSTRPKPDSAIKGSLSRSIGTLKHAKQQVAGLFKTDKHISDSLHRSKGGSPIANRYSTLTADSVRKKIDSSTTHLIQAQQKAYTAKFSSAKAGFLGLFKKPFDIHRDSVNKRQDIPTYHLVSRPWVGVGGGYISYNYNYRASIDTPFAENNIRQHNITGSTGLMLGGVLPFRLNFWIRRSNSILYQDITDVQISFDPAGFRNRLTENLQRRLRALAPSLHDSTLEKLASLKSMQQLNYKAWLSSPLNIQRLHESKELIQINTLHPESRPPDSAGQQRLDMQLSAAAIYIKLYDSVRLACNDMQSSVDSLQHLLMQQRKRMDQYRNLLNGKFGNWSSYRDWKGSLDKTSPAGLTVPAKYDWLMGIRTFSVGKTPVNYSELSAKNVTVNGFNFEYNSWYYFAVAAGLIDYRFHDFVTSTPKPVHQYMALLRAGLGRIEKNYFIVSLFTGQKQLYNLSTPSAFPNSIHVTGLTAETKWQAARNTYIVAEGGESIAPDYKATPVQPGGKFTLKGNLNKALSVKLYSFFPRLGGRIEGLYKYTGANYQSFSSFQTNAAVKSWYVKWNQNFLKRKLMVTASLRSNEFTNPYILQNYKSNTIFKSVTAVFRMRKWPVISVGYVPMSQLAVVGQQVVENRFQTITASLNHIYKIGDHQAFTTVLYNRFFNTNTDTGYIYYNASSFYLAQNIVFRLFTAGVAIADSRNTQYNLVAGEINLRIPLVKTTVLSMGVKINDLNRQQTRTGGRLAMETGLGRHDRISINYDKSYLPGIGKQLLNNEMGSIQYSRSF